MEILNVYGSVLFTSTLTVLRDVSIEAIKAKANLRDANLRGANLRGANLYGANLRDADLYDADLRDADLRGANLGGADLRDANLRGADLRDANLYGANLYGADLRGANLGDANLRDANLRDANLRDAKNSELAVAQLQFIPTEGQFVGWKKCKNGVIVKLGITKEAKRSHSTGRKCRCSRAKVLEVFGAEVGISMHDSSFTYTKGQYVSPTNGFDEDRWNECGSGIHFFITREEAEDYA